ncbi:hypothetical protein [Rhizobium leguminosarum]|uniref:hypothetical protein n=1 Tax=Rhizobium leguminosarum TaxID=384 RepID=UPI001039E4E8|nr:hypothetical protein [Rhizobium leguminosarum]TBZ79682.1 hypothetical protein E0H53_31815 [Rhizobium leguminosarum bv. viciae]TBZ97044.1 hypothetical protein E0H63_30045 [Rhizobium leguminosarum bv. viciae]
MNEVFIDKESVLARVHNLDSRGYLAEAIDCYHAGAYRASVVMTACAVFEDLRYKLRDFAPFDDTAMRVSKLIEEAFDEQRSYEARVFEQLKNSKMLGEPGNKRYLSELLTARNHAAHASGLPTTQIKAAKFISEGVERVLGKKLQWAEKGVSELLERMKRIDLFPSFVQNRSIIAAEELENLDPRVHSKMIMLIADGIGKHSALYDKNARLVFECFAEQCDPEMRSYLFEKLINGRTLPSTSTWLLDVIAADPEILAFKAKNSSAVDAALSAIITDAPDDNERLAQLSVIFEAMLSTQSEAVLCERYRETIRALCNRLWMRPLTSALGKEGRLRDMAEHVLLARTRDHTAAEHLLEQIYSKWEHGEEALFAKYLTDRAALTLIVNLCLAGDAGMDRCSKLTKRGCTYILDIRAKAIKFLRENENEAWRVLDVDDDETGPSSEEFYEHYLKAEPEWLIPEGYGPSEEEQEESRRRLQAFSLRFNAKRKASASLEKAG